MPSITDDISKKMVDKTLRNAPGAVENTVRVVDKALEKSKKGICLVFKGGAFTCESLMKAVKFLLYQKKEDIKFSNRNISIDELKESGTVKTIDGSVTQEVMQYFDKYCQKFHIQYTAMVDDRNPEEPSYMVFFRGNDDSLILKAMKEAMKDWQKDNKERQQREQAEKEQEKERSSSADGHEQSNTEQEKEDGKARQERNSSPKTKGSQFKNNSKKKENPEERESVKAKLAFFRDRAEFLNGERMKDIKDRHQFKERYRSDRT